jgi:hypothetical protein
MVSKYAKYLHEVKVHGKDGWLVLDRDCGLFNLMVSDHSGISFDTLADAEAFFNRCSDEFLFYPKRRQAYGRAVHMYSFHEYFKKVQDENNLRALRTLGVGQDLQTPERPGAEEAAVL